MKNFVQPGENLEVLAPYALTSGQGCLVGSLFGIASNDTANGAQAVIVTVGVFDITKAAGVAVTAGALVYWDNAARAVTTTATGNKAIGAATQAAAAGDATARVKLTGQVS